ncbi:sortilin [Aplysia californica]|uniref:Sortilin n=1 Tax=Aplysia californica TaxID=6500 RepID=A0ABM1ACJ5_APLCA|nr:sortilin [Aplysia californica]
MEVTKRRPLFTSLVAFVILSISLWSGYCSAADHVTSFQQSVSDVESESHSDQGSFLRLLRKRRDAVPDDVTTTESEKYDQRCLNQKEKFSELRNSIKAGQRLEETYTFLNESKFNLALAWAGVDDDGTLLILTTDRQHMMAAVSTLWRSTDNGRSWKNWNDHVDNNIFRQSDGLQRNPHNPKKVYLIGYEHFLYVTEDGGEKWHKSDLVHDDEGQKLTAIDEQLEFHPESDYEDYVMVTSNDRKLYVTYDNFQSKMEESIKSDVHIVKWGTKEQGKAKSIFATTGEYKNPLLSTGPALLDLERYDSERKIWEKIQSKVSMFDVQGKFIYASVYKSDKPKNEEDEKLMMISSDGGESWNEAQLPTLIGDRFYSVLDMSEGLIFMHVDNPGDTGHGVLYTSWENGIVYSESLPNHLFPNYNTVHDFYKIKSIRGVYLASQMSYDKSIHTVITYNLGGEWKNVSRPIGVPCENSEEEGCFLQIHNAYSIHRGIKARLPHSLDKAYGLVLVHGHVASNLQTTDPDVYMSTDGGYNFRMVLKGPHAYEIADSGGLVVAVPLNDPYPKTIKFSTDEGNCWHVYKFTDQEIKFTGLLTEPGGKSLTISVWGYLKDTKKWTLNVIDFGKVVTKHCES